MMKLFKKVEEINQEIEKLEKEREELVNEPLFLKRLKLIIKKELETSNDGLWVNSGIKNIIDEDKFWKIIDWTNDYALIAKKYFEMTDEELEDFNDKIRL